MVVRDVSKPRSFGRRAFLTALAAGSAGILAAGCSSGGTQPLPGGTRVYGNPAAVGNGRAVVYSETGVGGQASVIAIELDAAALEGLPAEGARFSLSVPPGVSPVKEVSLDWQPGGHPPPGIYNVPHFDMHFYFRTAAERALIGGGPIDTTKPAVQFVPAGYVGDPASVPGDGTHYSNPAAPEFNGEPFTNTFIYGFFEGQMTFYEPMVTLSYLRIKPVDDVRPVSQPQAWQARGYYPQSYRVTYDATSDKYHIRLEQLTLR